MITRNDRKRPVTKVLGAAYCSARYAVSFRRRWLPLRVGERSDELAGALRQMRARQGCLVTAFNPGSRVLAPGRNAARHWLLRSALRKQGWRWRPAVSDGEGWPQEFGCYILGMSPVAGCHLGRRFGQAALLWTGRGQTPRLIWC